MVEPLYDGELRETWMNGLAEQDKYNVKHILALFAYLGVPESYMDAGCGTGAMVRAAQKLGVRSYGLDQLVDDTWGPGFYHVNLVDRFILPGEGVELVTSFEVAEHLHMSAHATFCETLCGSLKAGGTLVFSAARPGQAGTGHIACRPTAEWHDEFILRGLSYNDFMTMSVAHIFSRIRSPLNYMWDNLMVFSK